MSWGPSSLCANPMGTLRSISEGISRWVCVPIALRVGESPARLWLHLSDTNLSCVLSAGVRAINLSDFIDVMA